MKNQRKLIISALMILTGISLLPQIAKSINEDALPGGGGNAVGETFALESVDESALKNEATCRDTERGCPWFCDCNALFRIWDPASAGGFKDIRNQFRWYSERSATYIATYLYTHDNRSERAKLFLSLSYKDVPYCKVILIDERGQSIPTIPAGLSCVGKRGPVPLCCCKKIESGVLGRKNECAEKIIGQSGDLEACKVEGAMRGENWGDYAVFPAPANGDCSSLEIESGKYTPEKESFGITAEKLQQDAEASLNPFHFTSVLNLLGRITLASFASFGAILMIMYIWAGFLWMTAQGNSEQTGKAKTIIVWTSLGAVVILSSYILVDFVIKSILGQ